MATRAEGARKMARNSGAPGLEAAAPAAGAGLGTAAPETTVWSGWRRIIGAGGALRLLVVPVIAAWGALHLLTYQADVLSRRDLLGDPLHQALAAAGVQVVGTEMTFFWENPPGVAPTDVASVLPGEGRIHVWMASMGRSLGVRRWQVLERRDGPPFLLGLGGDTPSGGRLEVWLYGADPALIPWPGTSRGGVVVRMAEPGGADARERLIREGLPLLAVDWLAGTRPHAWMRTVLAWDPDDGDGQAEAIVRSLAGRVVARRRVGPIEEMWIASPRGAAGSFPEAASTAPAKANVYLAWPSPEPEPGVNGSPPNPRPVPGGRLLGSSVPSTGLASMPQGQVAELVWSPSPLSELGQTVERMWGGKKR